MKPMARGGTTKAKESSKHALDAKEDELRMFLEPFTKVELEDLIVELFCPSAGSKLPKHGKKESPPPTYDKLMHRLKHDTKWCKLFVHQLAYTTTNADLEKFYSQFGRIKEAVVLVDKNGNSKGFGFVTFSTADEALAAAAIHKRKIDGRVTHCALAWKGNPKKHDAADGGGESEMHARPHGRAHGPVSMTVPSMHGGRLSTAATAPPSDGFRGTIRLTKMSSGASSTGSTSRDFAADRRLFVHSLAWRTDDEDLRRVFEQYGEVAEAAVIREKKTGKSKGYGFVTFVRADGAARALEEPDKMINDRLTHCNYACDRSSSSGDGSSRRAHMHMHAGPPRGGLLSKPRVLKSLSADSTLLRSAALEPRGGRAVPLRAMRSVEESMHTGSVWEIQRTRPLLRDRTRSSASSSAKSEDAATIGAQLAEARAHTPIKRDFYRSPATSTLADRRAALSAQAHARLRAAPMPPRKSSRSPREAVPPTPPRARESADATKAAGFRPIPETVSVLPPSITSHPPPKTTPARPAAVTVMAPSAGGAPLAGYYRVPTADENIGELDAPTAAPKTTTVAGASKEEATPTAVQNIAMHPESDLFDQFFLDARLEAAQVLDAGGLARQSLDITSPSIDGGILGGASPGAESDLSLPHEVTPHKLGVGVDDRSSSILFTPEHSFSPLHGHGHGHGHGMLAVPDEY